MAFLVLLVLFLLGRALPNLPGMARPVEIRDISLSPAASREGHGFRLSRHGKALAMVSGKVALRPGAVYRVRFTLSDVRTTGPVTLIYDLCARDYDSPEQQGELVLDGDIGPRPVTRLIPAGGSPPEEAALRFFLAGPGEVTLGGLRFERLSSAIGFLRLLLLAAAVAVVVGVFALVRSRFPRFAHGCALAGAVLVLLSRTSPPPVSDAHWTVPAMHSLFTQGNLELSEFSHDIYFRGAYGLEPALDGIYYRYPVGMPLLTLPAGFLGALWHGDGDLEAIHIFAARAVFAAVIVAFFLLAAHVAGSQRRAAVLTLIFALATPNFSALGGGLWTHGGTQFLLCVAALLLWKGHQAQDDTWTAAAALPLAFSYLVRPSNAVPIVIITVYVALCRRRAFVPFALIGALMALAFLAWSLSVYGRPLPPYYTMKLGGGQFWMILAGHLISPNRGLLIWCPFFLFSAWGVWRWLRGPDPVLRALAAVVPAGLVVISFWPIWWGGFSVGPRLLCDLLPFLTLTLLPALDALTVRRGMRPVLVLFGLMVAWGFFFQWRAATVRAVWRWNFATEHRQAIDKDPSRAWSWREMQMMEGI